MTLASGIIDALLARRPGPLLLERQTGLPYGWALWIRHGRSLPPAPVPATPLELAGVLAARAGVRERGEELGRWAALYSLLRQGWQPAPRDERLLRWCSGIGSLLLHVGFVALLAWIALLQLLIPLPPSADGGGRVAVAFVTRDGTGDGSAPDATVASGVDAPSASQAAATTAMPPAAAPAPVVDDSFSFLDIPVPTPPDAAPMPVLDDLPVAPEQPVQVTVVEVPTRAHVLPPTTPRAMPEQVLRQREVAAPVVVPDMPVLAPPVPRQVDVSVPPPQLQPREIAAPAEVMVPELRMPAVRPPAPLARELPAPELRQREVDGPVDIVLPAVPLPGVPAREVAMAAPPEVQLRERAIEALPQITRPVSASVPSARPVAVPEVSAPGAEVRRRDVAPAVAGNAAVPASAAVASPAASGPASAAPASSGPAPATAAADDWSRGPRSDDWGQSAQAGAGTGVFDGQGRARLPDVVPAAAAERGAPGGDNDRWSEARIAQSGNWMQRPAEDFSGTRFEQYWVPNESLLAEWVRRGVRNMTIPIPGTGKRINCVISLLQLGGGCGVSDPNMNEQPAVARPPPDVPFKPDLQDDNGSVRP